MIVEFISLINVWESGELRPRPGGAPQTSSTAELLDAIPGRREAARLGGE
jgi:hypothetical protein